MTLDRSRSRLEMAVGGRHGIVSNPVSPPRRPADPAGVVHASVASEDGVDFESAGGGAGRSIVQAECAAIAESLERYAAAALELPMWEPDEQDRCGVEVFGFDDFSLHSSAQRAAADFPWVADYGPTTVTPMFDLRTGTECWVPAGLVGLRSALGGVPTSSGLAADFLTMGALLRATQEVVERDALMTTWLHGVPGREVALADPVGIELPAEATIMAFDLTPDYSPHPVCLVVAEIPLLGRPRIGVGVACRSTWAAAADKAMLEALQSVVFVGEYLARFPNYWLLEADDCRTFDQHAIFYTANPERWLELPLIAQRSRCEPPPDAERLDRAGAEPKGVELERLVATLGDNAIRLLYRDLTTPDMWQIGLRVVRVLSPTLTPIHHDHRFPHLGGQADDLGLRYRWAPPGRFPRPFPHPLG